MEAFIFQHVEFEGPGAILPILEAKGHRIHRVNLYAGDAVPDSSAVDFAVLMGGPMSALDEDKFPFLSAEKQFCRALFAANTPLLIFQNMRCRLLTAKRVKIKVLKSDDLSGFNFT